MRAMLSERYITFALLPSFVTRIARIFAIAESYCRKHFLACQYINIYKNTTNQIDFLL